MDATELDAREDGTREGDSPEGNQRESNSQGAGSKRPTPKKAIQRRKQRGRGPEGGRGRGGFGPARVGWDSPLTCGGKHPVGEEADGGDRRQREYTSAVPRPNQPMANDHPKEAAMRIRLEEAAVLLDVLERMDWL